MRCGDGYLFLDNRAALTRALCAGCREASRSHDSLETTVLACRMAGSKCHCSMAPIWKKVFAAILDGISF
jgi:hypothetical protein